jgi:hypothetical protein
VGRAVLVSTLGLVLLLGRPASAGGQSFRLEGQLSTWFTLNDEEPSTPGIGIRYLPLFSVEKPLAGDRMLDGELSLNVYGAGNSPGWERVDTTGRVKAYRAWGRYKSSRFEVRGGLQKINFGSATLLRPLMWFDSVDPRDPLQITDGVKGVLVRQFLSRDYSVWVWGLYGNDSVKGLERSPTRSGTPEFGGRFQLPLFKGALGVTTHHRTADVSGTLAGAVTGNPRATENRLALDGKWDVGIGLWFEGAWAGQRQPGLTADDGALTVGADYTFGLGNGLHVLGEHFVRTGEAGLGLPAATTQFSAFTVSYPLGLLDTISGILYVDASRAQTYRFINWQRTYDRWRFYLMAFWNPPQVALEIGEPRQSTSPAQMTGKGIQVLVVFNHGALKR